MNLDKQNKEKIVIIAGFLLILGVGLLTFQRAQDTKTSPENISAPVEDKFDYPLLASAELQKKIFAKEALRIIDLRGAEAFANEHIPHSVNVAMENLAQVELESAEETLILVGDAKTDYAQALKILENKNAASKIFILTGGVTAWKNSQNSTISPGDPASFTDQAKVTYLAPEELKKLLDAGEAIYILDVRETHLFAAGHLPKAVNIPLTELEHRYRELPLNLEIVIYGANELHGFQAGVLAYDLNLFTAYVLQGGIEAWRTKGFEIAQ